MLVQDARDQMATVTGVALPVASDAATAVREIYLEKSPGAFWVDFGDFRWFRMETILNVRFISGVQTVAQNVCYSIRYSSAHSDVVLSDKRQRFPKSVTRSRRQILERRGEGGELG